MKPFIICAPDGYIVGVYGLYPATWNDAKILEHIINHNPKLMKLLSENDIMILDRGFRDIVNKLKTKYKLRVLMPNLLPKEQKQFSAEQANESRLCTKIRWIIEVVNGRLKMCYRALDNRVENKSLTHFFTDFKIASALYNRFHRRLFSDSTNAAEIAQKMFNKKDYTNELMKIVLDKGLHRKSQMVNIKNLEEELTDFPKLTLECIKNHITFGSYQLNHSLSYLAEHFTKNNGRCNASVSEVATSDSSKIVTAKINPVIRHHESIEYI